MTARVRADSGPHGSARGRFRGGSASRPVLVGYLVGLALIMIARQLARVTGVESAGGHSPRTSSRSPRALAAISLPPPPSRPRSSSSSSWCGHIGRRCPACCSRCGWHRARWLQAARMTMVRPWSVRYRPALLAWLAGGLQRRRAVTARSLCCDRTVVRPALHSACTFAARSGRAAQFVFSGCKPPW
jgi:hypothetical protein